MVLRLDQSKEPDSTVNNKSLPSRFEYLTSWLTLIGVTLTLLHGKGIYYISIKYCTIKFYR